MNKPNTPLAEDAVLRALDDVELAQRMLDRACQALSPVRGAMPEWEAVAREGDRVRAVWGRLNKRRQRGGLSLEREPALEGSR